MKTHCKNFSLTVLMTLWMTLTTKEWLHQICQYYDETVAMFVCWLAILKSAALDGKYTLLAGQCWTIYRRGLRARTAVLSICSVFLFTMVMHCNYEHRGTNKALLFGCMWLHLSVKCHVGSGNELYCCEP